MFTPIRRVDHIIVETGNPLVVFNAIRSALGFTVAWPVQRTEHGYESGGLFAGNVNVEVIRFDGSSEQAKQSHFWGFALEPNGEIDRAVAELMRRGISCGKPDQTEGYTTAALADYSYPGPVFLCQYHFDTLRWRAELAEAYVRENIGMGVVGITEIVIEARDVATSREKWERLLGESDPDRSHWRSCSGPAVRLVAGERDRLRSLVVELDGLDNRTVTDVGGLKFESKERP